MAGESFGERTQEATPKRRDEARNQGQVARSPEINSALILLMAMLSLGFFGPRMLERLIGVSRFLLSGRNLSVESPADVYVTWQMLTQEVLLAIAPFLLSIMVVGVIANIFQVGFLFTTKPLNPKWQVLDPIQGFARKFGRRGIVELFKALFKVAIIGTVAYLTVSKDLETFVPLLGIDSGPLLTEVGDAVIRLGYRVGLALLALAALDYGYQRWEHEKSIQMSTKEIEEEQKQLEGDPHVKARVRVLQHQLSRNRMITAVADADVVITNPTHVAVALQYDRSQMDAPIVIARGIRKVALRIKEEARKAEVPIYEDPPLARLLFKESTLGKAIPAALYKAVAQVLAHVWRLKNARAEATQASATAAGGLL